LAFLHGDTFSFRKISHNLLTSKKFYLSWSQAIRKNKGKVKKKKEKKMASRWWILTAQIAPSNQFSRIKHCHSSEAGQ
jgi:hypothetical protein